MRILFVTTLFCTALGAAFAQMPAAKQQAINNRDLQNVPNRTEPPAVATPNAAPATVKGAAPLPQGFMKPAEGDTKATKPQSAMNSAKNGALPSQQDKDWAKKVVWYQIFPERFANGDPTNDPRLLDIRGAYPNDTAHAWQIHPWGSDWYKMQPYEKENGKDVWYNLQRRRYGGDLKGVIDHLDYLQQLGINAIYLNPIFFSPSLHKYDAKMYHHVDPTFGPDPEGDRRLIAAETYDDPKTWKWTKADLLALALIRACHERGMYIIFDGVFNHLGITAPPFQDLVRNQTASRYKDWFEIESLEDPAKGTHFKYKGWFNVAELPEIKEDKNGIVAAPKSYIFACTKRWMDPNNDGNTADGIDGWRLDVAFCIAHPFWKDWHAFVRAINPNAYTTAEVIDKIEVCKPYVVKREFGALMNYNFAFNVGDYFMSEKKRITTTEFDRLMHSLVDAFGAKSYEMQNLFDSHDTNRFTSQIVNRDQESFRNWQKYFDISHGWNPNYLTRKPNEQEYGVARLMAAFQMTFLGAPMIYYGDEVGMWGANDPDCRKPMLWANQRYEAEATNPDQSPKKTTDKVAPDAALLAYYSKLVHIRLAYPALQLGDYKTVLIDDAKQLYAFSRSYGKGKTRQTVWVLMNNSEQTQTTTLAIAPQHLVNLLNSKPYERTNGGFTLNLASKESVILAEKQ